MERHGAVVDDSDGELRDIPGDEGAVGRGPLVVERLGDAHGRGFVSRDGDRVGRDRVGRALGVRVGDVGEAAGVDVRLRDLVGDAEGRGVARAGGQAGDGLGPVGQQRVGDRHVVKCVLANIGNCDGELCIIASEESTINAGSSIVE